jgi:DNA-binding NarL/FixJ family response regulator
MYKSVITVGIVDDHALFREGLVNLLSEYEIIEVLFEARNGLQMHEQLHKYETPDVILMDINMPGMNGHEATAWLKVHYPLVHVLALSMYEDDMSIIKMIRGGACGYILKESNVQELVRAITSIKENGYYINEVVSGRLIKTLHGTADDNVNAAHKLLTTRELEFVRLSCSDLTYKEIADAMKVSPRTVDGYREAVFEKLQVKSRTGLVLYAIKTGIYQIS